jgi:hypothetical protein
MNIIVFSKDRAAQCDLFLKSMDRFFEEFNYMKINVLYTYSNKEFEMGYEKLQTYWFQYHNVNFIKEQNFKTDVLNLVDEKISQTVFFVDDIVWKETFSIRSNEMEIFEKEPLIACLSLRLHPKLTFCYPANINQRPPQFETNLTWFWQNERGDYGYPMSLDGHIFRTAQIYPLLYRLKYKNPNNLEGLLAMFPLVNCPKMICFEKSRIFNNPINKVQTNNPNRHGHITSQHLNEEFLTGRRLAYDPYIGLENKACHEEKTIQWIEPEKKKRKQKK